MITVAPALPLRLSAYRTMKNLFTLLFLFVVGLTSISSGKPVVGPENGSLVIMGGGRQWRLTKAYGGTRTEKEFHQVLARGGIIGGSSAGATIQGSFLARGDTSGNTVMIGDVQKGFGFLKNSAIDQHLIARDRQKDLLQVLQDPERKSGSPTPPTTKNGKLSKKAKSTTSKPGKWSPNPRLIDLARATSTQLPTPPAFYAYSRRICTKGLVSAGLAWVRCGHATARIDYPP